MKPSPFRLASLSPWRTAAAALIIAFGTACSSATEPPGGKGSQPEVLNQLPRTLTATEVKVRDASNDFSFALMGTVVDSQRTSNVFISPLSASFALGMTMNGAAGSTQSEMQSALKLGNLTQSEVNAGYKSLIELLTSLDPTVEMRIANSIWYRNNFQFHQTFFDTTKKYFNAEVRGLNFGNVPAALSAINGWVSTATNNKIKEVLNDVRPEDIMFLINAIYFKGSWRAKFETSQTTNATFNASTGGVQTVPFMNRRGQIPYAETSTYQAVDLQYGNSAFSMVVILPKAGQDVNTIMKTFTPGSWDALAATFRASPVTLALPKLKLEYARQLKGNLQFLGMRAPFEPSRADFSRMTPDPTAYISFVKQDSYVDVNEEGTEAAAVTTVGVSTVSAPVEVSVRVDRPYIFVIRERLSGTIMFMGRIVRMP
ncbi:MAG: serpin family protein [Gemmatimonas sp.]